MSDEIHTPKTIKQCIAELDLAIANAGLVIAGIPGDDVFKLVRAFNALHDQKKALEESLKEINKLHSQLSEVTIPLAFEANDIKPDEGVKLDGRNFKVAIRTNASIPAAKREEGFKWLREVAKCPEIIAETVNPKQLSSFIEEFFEEHAELPPENAVTVYFQTYTAIRRG